MVIFENFLANQIVLQDSVDDSIASNGTLNQQQYEREGKDFGTGHESEEHDRDPDSEYLDRTLPAFSDRKREMIDGKETFSGSVENIAPEGNGILPSPSDVSRQRSYDSKSHSPIYDVDHRGTWPVARYVIIFWVICLKYQVSYRAFYFLPLFSKFLILSDELQSLC